MATCKDCLHYNVCTFHLTGNENERCCHFKNKADVVEVVKCKDCMHRRAPTRCSLWYGSLGNDDYFCEYGDDFYCAFGERKDGEKDEDIC